MLFYALFLATDFTEDLHFKLLAGVFYARKKGEASFDSSPGCSVELPRLLGRTACNFSFVMKRTGRD
ncbi:MAG: hypothetical protein CVV39_06575 [Planctomycetes bacterium HGW-Planctomycetes-1]|nr:MAG: hypothetical protein CVV39_06575 [Planctomycetes bacterium HGW-Planctomycetes-1]